MSDFSPTLCLTLSRIQQMEKLNNQMTKRGCTKEGAKKIVDTPYITRNSTNFATGNSTTVYYNKDSSYVIVDDITKE